MRRTLPVRLVLPFRRFTRFNSSPADAGLQQKRFLEEYKVRLSLERLIYHYASQPLHKFLMEHLYAQLRKLNKTVILQIARDTIERLLVYNARRLRRFRGLPYLVMLNPAVLELYHMYLRLMAVLLKALANAPVTAAQNDAFVHDVLSKFIEIHADSLPTLSKGFGEVHHLLLAAQVKLFLDSHLVERISMRLIAHQHVQLTQLLTDGSYVAGGNYNGVVKQLDLREVVRKNAELVNDIFLMKYDQAVPVTVDCGLRDLFWGKLPAPEQPASGPIVFPYIEYHLDYIFQELFKNLFRAHIENGVLDPVQVTVSTSESPSFMELRIRDKGKGIPPQTVSHMFDYLYTTYELGEGDSYKTLNVPPGAEGNTVAGMGYGLPLSKAYIEIFNDTVADGDVPQVKGLLTLQTYWGWGTDVYLKTVGQ